MKPTLNEIAYEFGQKLNYWRHISSGIKTTATLWDVHSMVRDFNDVKEKLDVFMEPIRYSVFYDEIGIDNGDAGESVYSTPSLAGAQDFYNDMESHCNFILLWDRLEQKVVKQKGK